MADDFLGNGKRGGGGGAGGVQNVEGAVAADEVEILNEFTAGGHGLGTNTSAAGG